MRLKLLFSTLFCVFYLSKSSIAQNQQTIDSLNTVLENQSISDKERIESHILLIDNYERRRDIKMVKKLVSLIDELPRSKVSQAWKLYYQGRFDTKGDLALQEEKYEEALSLFLDQNNEKGAFRVYYAIGGNNAQQGKYTQGRNHLFQALKYNELYNKVNEPKSYQKFLGIIHSNIAATYQGEGNYEKALEYSLEARKIGKKYSIKNIELSALFVLTNIYRSLNQYENSISVAKEVVQIVEQGNFSPQSLGAAYNNLATQYVLTSQNEKAFIYFSKAIEEAKKIKNILGLTKGYINLGNLKYEEKKYKESEDYYRRAYKYAEKTNSDEVICNVILSLSKVLLVRKSDRDEVKKMVLESIELAEKLKSPKLLSDAYKNLSRFYYLEGEVEKANFYDTKYTTTKDSLLNAENLAKIEELEIQYETAEKEREIEELTQEAKIQELEVKQRSLYLLALGVSAVLLLFALYFYYRQRSLKKNQELVRVQQHLLRSQINPHFFFNVLSSIRTFIIDDKSPQEVIIYLSKLAKLMRYTLEKSTEESIYLEEEISILEDYLAIQKMRFGEKLSYEIHYDEELDTEEITIPPMLVQPFIENALEHGILPKEEGGKIEIRFELASENELALRIIDNGIGIDEAMAVRQTQNQNHKSMALKITQERLKILNRNRQKLVSVVIEDLKKLDQQGTQVVFSLPI